MHRKLMPLLAACVFALPATSAAVTYTTTHGLTNHDLDGMIAVGDLLSGLIPLELPGDNGFHPANPASGDPMHPDGLPAFTDDVGALSPVTGLLNDFPGEGTPTKLLEYDLGGPQDIARIHILTGNADRDGRIWSTAEILYSTDGGATFDWLGYFQSDPSGTINNAGSDPRYGSTLVEIFDDTGANLISGATHLWIFFYSVDNTLGEMRDPFDGVNPFTGVDDGLTHAFVSPLVYEIDVLAPGGGCVGDVDGDGDTDLADLADLLGSYGRSSGDPGYDPNADFDNSGTVDLADLAFLLGDYGCGL